MRNRCSDLHVKSVAGLVTGRGVFGLGKNGLNSSKCDDGRVDARLPSRHSGKGRVCGTQTLPFIRNPASGTSTSTLGEQHASYVSTRHNQSPRGLSESQNVRKPPQSLRSAVVPRRLLRTRKNIVGLFEFESSKDPTFGRQNGYQKVPIR